MFKKFSAFTALCAFTVLFGSVALSRPRSSTDLEVRSLSSRPDMVSGGDALIQIAAAGSLASQKITVMLDRQDVSKDFRPAGQTLIGHIDGLVMGNNTLVVSVAGKSLANLTLVNHPITGPLFSGPHQTPFICQTEGAGLGPALDADCSAKTVVAYLYKSTEPPAPRAGGQGAGRGRGVPGAPPPGFKPYDPSGPRPDDLAQVSMSDGKKVDYIVRRETGTINRAIYQIAFLHQPGQALPDPWTATPGWNGRLVYVFGPGVRAGYHQGAPPNPMDDQFLSHGYAVAVSSLNVFGTNPDGILSAETMMMVKEHFAKNFGAPRYTIGFGGSGGSMAQHMISQNYPGLLDGIMPSMSFSDAMSFLQPLFDCELLVNAINSSSLTWTPEQKTAASGKRDFSFCTSNGTRYPNLRPANCDPNSLTPAMVYNAATNPKGARCTYQDDMVNVFGRDPKTGFARSPFDNVGVQYGLRAFNMGRISFDQFADLNARVGGHDIDGNIVASREVADPEALRIAYQSGLVNQGSGGLATIPIIDFRPYRDEPAADGNTDVHDAYRSGVTRARLIAANGNANNQVIVTVPGGGGGGPAQDQGPGSAFAMASKENLGYMDQWLANIANDTSSKTKAEKVVESKPNGLVDACYDHSGAKITDPAKCAEIYPYASDPRLVAGAPPTDDIFKCQLKPLDAKDYAHPVTPEQLAKLKTIFPEGVCDYSRPGVSQQKPADSWRKY